MASYVLPQVLVYQEFLRSATATAQPLPATILGEQFALNRYSVSNEKMLIGVGTYNPDADTSYLWPNRPAGGVVDQTYTKVFFDNALLRYFHHATGGSPSDYVSAVQGYKNRIRAAGTVFATANGYSRDASLYRDVIAGDVVILAGAPYGIPTTFQTSVLGLIPEVVPAVVSAAGESAANQITTVESAIINFTAGTENNVTATADGTTYDGTVDGDITEVYTIKVINGGTAGTALFQVTSQSGNDDVSPVSFPGFGTPMAIGTRGLMVTFQDTSSAVPGVTNYAFILGQTWTSEVTQAYTKATSVSSGVYNGAASTTYVINVVSGGTYNDSHVPQITVTTTTGVDFSGPTSVVLHHNALSNLVAVGTQGVYIRFNANALVAGDSFTIPVKAKSNGAMQTIVLANNLPDAFRGIKDISPTSSSSGAEIADLDLKLYMKRNVQIPAQSTQYTFNWTQADTQITINEGIEATDSSWTLGGELVPLPIDTASIFVQHRDRVSTNGNSLGTISDVADIPTVFASAPVVDPDNPLVFGVYNALNNANGQEVTFVAIYSHIGDALTLDDWLLALAILEGHQDVYSIVPLTYDGNVQNAVVSHVLAQSAPTVGRWRGCFLNKQAVQTIGVYTSHTDGSPILATIEDDPNTSGMQYTIVDTTGGAFITSGVVPGDIVYANYGVDILGNTTYSQYVVDEVISNDSLRLFTGPSMPVSVPSKIEVHRNLSKDQLASNLAKNPGLFSNRRVKLVWPDVLGNAGVSFPGYFLCCALAGLRSGVLPHQGLTNVAIVGFDDLSRTTPFFSDSELDTLAASGYWIVTQDPNSGQVYTRHQLTTGDQTDINQREDSVTSNIDFLSYIFLNRLQVYIGKGNVTPTMINILQGEVLSIIAQYSNTIDVQTLGPQIVSGKIQQLSQDPAFKDRVLCYLDLTLPAPFNNMELHLVVS